MVKQQKKSPLKVGKVTYGTMSIEEAFRKALEPYFISATLIDMEKKQKGCH